jgi:hypothetical protein
MFGQLEGFTNEDNKSWQTNCSFISMLLVVCSIFHYFFLKFSLQLAKHRLLPLKSGHYAWTV